MPHLDEFTETLDIRGRAVDTNSLIVRIDPNDYPRFDDAYFDSGQYQDGELLSDEDLEYLTDHHYWLLNQMAQDAYHNRAPDTAKDAGVFDEELTEMRRLAGLPPLEENRGLGAAMNRAEKSRQQAIRKARAWMKQTGKDAEAARKEFDLLPGDVKALTESQGGARSILDIITPEQLDRVLEPSVLYNQSVGFTEDDEIYDLFYEYYLDRGDMPYGVAKARTGDPASWIEDQIYQDFGDEIEARAEELGADLPEIDDQTRRSWGSQSVMMDSDQSVEEGRGVKDWARKFSWFFHEANPREIRDYVRSVDDRVLKLLSKQAREEPDKGSPRDLQIRLIDQELKRRYGLTPRGNIRESQSDDHRVSVVMDLMKQSPDHRDHPWLDDHTGKWTATNEFLVGGFAGRGFDDETPEAAVSQVVDYFDQNLNHHGLVGQVLRKSGWPDLDRFSDYVLGQYRGSDEESSEESDSLHEGSHWSDNFDVIETVFSVKGNELGAVVQFSDGSYGYYDDRKGAVGGGFESHAQAKAEFSRLLKSRLQSTSGIRESEEFVTKRVVGHEDREARMMQRELLKIRDYADQLVNMLDGLQDADFPHWWQAKLVKAGDYMSTIKHFLEGEEQLANRGDGEIDRVSVDPVAQELMPLDDEDF